MGHAVQQGSKLGKAEYTLPISSTLQSTLTKSQWGSHLFGMTLFVYWRLGASQIIDQDILHVVIVSGFVRFSGPSAAEKSSVVANNAQGHGRVCRKRDKPPNPPTPFRPSGVQVVPMVLAPTYLLRRSGVQTIHSHSRRWIFLSIRPRPM